MPDAGLGARLAAELTALALCWRIVRPDGVALGFTTHDRPLAIGGMIYDSAPGMAPSAVASSDGLDIDTMDVAGALSADAITAADLAAGRFDGAAVELFLIDWQAPDEGRQLLARGTLGTIETGTGPDRGFSATLRGPTAALASTRIESCSPECRAELGDRRCRVDMRGRWVRWVVLEGDGERVRFDGIDAVRAGDFIEGRVRVVSGDGAGIERRAIAADDDWLVLDEALMLAPGTAVALREGCDKRFVTCVERFANAANFRGEPHVPGGDVLTRFPGL
ncbi:DUF2163 domain-containing protein [Sandarakinorhabdus sp. DWP1-3-1]|uniref:DUF2163 domain-containing protein n=1 Tax=Sandarakinorhabdus sp. DWP1-3-1 TaxID=2804627 RepID=UPI003CEC273D